ncbi:hypothetical protein E1344_24215 [Salmonella enterica subsp. enterica serovar Bareilly]|nr:hypothetical protein [Salmonella enterica subsp. enterica serovar Bareilly]
MKKNTVILYTPCSFTDLAFRYVVQNISTFQCQVKTVLNLSEFLLGLKLIKASENNIIVIDLIEQSAHWRVDYLCALWNFRRIVNNNDLGNVSFLLLGNTKQMLPSFLHHIPLICNLEKLEIYLLQALSCKNNFLLKPIKKINKNKRFLMYAITEGFNTTETSIALNTSLKNIRNRQEALMRQMGLKNRYEIALLAGKILL